MSNALTICMFIVSIHMEPNALESKSNIIKFEVINLSKYISINQNSVTI